MLKLCFLLKALSLKAALFSLEREISQVKVFEEFFGGVGEMAQD